MDTRFNMSRVRELRAILGWAVREARSEGRALPEFVLDVLAREREHRAAAALLREYERDHRPITDGELAAADRSGSASIAKQPSTRTRAGGELEQ